MGTFRKVDAEQAGPVALGILVPPSRRTFVILRPRALDWDLVVCRDDGTFRDFGHDEASACAQALYKALRQGATLETLPVAEACRVRARIGAFSLFVCERRPGQAYQPLTTNADQANAVVAALTPIVCPPDDVEQELYFNVRFFGS